LDAISYQLVLVTAVGLLCACYELLLLHHTTFVCQTFLAVQSVQQAWHRIVNTASTYAHAIASTSLLLPLSMSSKLWQWTKNGPAVQLPNIQYRVSVAFRKSREYLLLDLY